MNRRVHISAYLILTFLIGQLASVWHAVGHLEYPSNQAHVHESHSFAHVEHFSFIDTAKDSNSSDSDNEHCLIYHTFGANEAHVPLMPQMMPCLASLDNWQSVLTAVHSSHTFDTQIRGPPVRS